MKMGGHSCFIMLFRFVLLGLMLMLPVFLQTCTVGQYVIVETGSCLTRFTAGLVYCLYRNFQEVSVPVYLINFYAWK